MKIKISLFLAFSLSLLVGCSHVAKVGSIEARRPDGTTNHLDFVKIQGTSLLGPTQTGIYVVDRSTGSITPVTTTAAGNGLGPALVGAAGLVGGAAALGATLEPDQTTVSGNASASAKGGVGGNATATGGSSTASPVIGPSKPYRPPTNRPPRDKPPKH